MKTGIHPEYVEAHVRCTCGNEFTTRSTQPEIHVEICSNCHPFYTGRQKLVDTGGRVERFKRRAAKRQSGSRPSRWPRRSRCPTACPPRPPTAVDVVQSDAPGEKPGQLWAQRDAPVGGQAVLEGVMMRGVSTWAVAVRKPLPEQIGGRRASTPRRPPRGEIEVKSFPLTSVLKRHRALRLPIIRGVVALGESLAIGFKALGISANAQLPEEEEEISGGMWVGHRSSSRCCSPSACSSSSPSALTSLIKDQLGSSLLFWLVEGDPAHGDLPRLPRRCSRACATCAASSSTTAPSTRRSPATRRASPLTPENAQRFSRLHPRCGTSFLLIVMIVAIFVFAPIGLPAWYWLVLSRILGVPLIAGISFEIIKFAGQATAASAGSARSCGPGMQLQKLTTREPDLDAARRRDRRDGGGPRRRDAGRALRRGARRRRGRRLDACRIPSTA